MKTATVARPAGRTTAASQPSPQAASLGWLASGAGLLALAGAMSLPWLPSVLLAALAVAVGLGVFGVALAGRGPGVGHGVAGLVTALIALAVAATSALVPGLGIALVGDSSTDAGGVFPLPDGSPNSDSAGPAASPEVVTLRPVDVQASGAAPDSQDAAGKVVTFAPANAVDGDPTTAWRVPGDGVGASLVLTFDRPVHVASVAVIPGYAKVDPVDGSDRFAQNRRVSSADFEFSGGEVRSFSFSDQPELQVAAIGLDTTDVTLRITSSTSAQRDYTAVSELQVYGWALG